MFDLFISEFKRYRFIAIIFCTLQILLWVLIGKMTTIVEPHDMKNMGLIFSSCFGGGIFAFASMGLHRRKNHWTYLIHRPLASDKIHLALSMAGIILLFIAFVLPFLSVLVFLDLFTSNVIEARHYWYCFHLLAVTVSAYFIGSFAALSPMKGTMLSLWLVTYLMNTATAPLWFELVADFSFIVFGFYLASKAFKVNLQENSRNSVAILCSIVALQPVLLILLMMFQGIYYHGPVTILGMHPNSNTENNNYFNFTRKELPLQFQQLLEINSDTTNKSLIRQISLSKYHHVRRKNFRAPFKNQLFLKEHRRRFALIDENSSNLWIFSHQQGVFIGRNPNTDKVVGYLSLAGFAQQLATIDAADRFQTIPAIVDFRFVQTNDRIYTVDFKNKKIALKHQLPADEYYTKTVTFMFERAVFQSNKATYFIDQIDFDNKTKQVTAEHIIPHPTEIIYYDNVAITEVLNGFLVRYNDYHFYGVDQAGSALVYAKHDGDIKQISSYAFTENRVPSLLRNQPFILSPIVMNIVDGIVPSAIKYSTQTPKQYHYFWQQQRPFHIWLFCLLAALFSSIATYLLVRKMPLSNSNKTLWTLANLIFALPGLVAFLLLTNWHHFHLKKYRQTKRNQQAESTAELASVKEHANV